MSDPKGQQGQQEPSMEEILASIRRIISEDGDAAKPPAPVPPPPAATRAAPPVVPAPAPAGDVLDLTRRLDDDGSVLDLTERADPMPEPTKAAFSLGDFGDQFENKDDAMRFEPPRSGDLLMSSSTADLSANAFAALASLHDDPEPEAMAPRRSASGDMGALTVEELVREVLKPLLKDWLDQNLPPMVEQLVRGEIERVASSGRRR